MMTIKSTVGKEMLSVFGFNSKFALFKLTECNLS